MLNVVPVNQVDRERGQFSDFVLTRIVKAQEIDGEVANHELLSPDEQWARMLEMEIVLHPGIRWPKAVEADYGMEDGSLMIKTRAALAGYVLSRSNIDSSEDHRLEPALHHIWLRNPQTLYGVESASLAPCRAVAVQKAQQ